MTEEQKIAERLRTAYLGRHLYCFDALSSTNDYLMREAASLPHGSAAFTTDQYAGKGRRGKAWVAPKGQMAALSILLKAAPGTETPAPGIVLPITLVCGLAVARALKELFGLDFMIKWPNDIVCCGKKVCGILCESRLTKESSVTVCGMGVNLGQSSKFFEKAGIPHGTSIKQLTGKEPAAPVVAAEILNQFEQHYTAALSGTEQEKQCIFDGYNAVCVTLGQEIRALTPQEGLRGRAVAINPDGSLCIETAQGRTTLYAGEVSVRSLMGYI